MSNEHYEMSFTAIKMTLLQAVANNKALAAISPILGLIVEFFLNRWASDIILVLLLFVVIGVNTITGVMKAKRTLDAEGKSVFDEKVLRDKTKIKIIGYMLWLLCTYALMLAVKISAFLNDESTGEVLIQVPKAALHYPITCTYLFFMLVEALSARKNILSTGVRVPSFSTDAIKKIIPTDETGNE